MNNCPRCGAPIEGGRAYCSNPACGAAPSQAAPASRKVLDKKIELKLTFDFALVARLAAVLIVLIAAALLYFARR
ncbi:MAG TPA: hypothetical protein DCW72_09090 [Elusimicrobia bacterium]|nr:MAG: hypothetical protein A2X29_06185 [Elusimicrobia bacterium GWA2_64_40]OGR64099.1 MAG: hypothetical protein A2X30_12535 [Elusimicrobia bacterium GWB2_63_16]HAN05791.1 hypothetical protein [Elusimicrobiota bacterium]HAU90350.1 hypothetical protein [Elusimicrobiota bacterium]